MLPNTDHIGEPRSISRGGPNPQANDGVRGDAQNGPQANGEAQGVGGNANGADNGAVSRQVYRQAQRHNDKRRERPTYYYQADWPSWCLERGPDGKFVHGPDGKLKPSAFFKHVHPIIPFGAPVRKPGLAGGKVVGQMADDGIWDGKKDWTSEPRRTTWEEAKKAHRDGAALCVQATKLIPFDCDLEKMELVEKTLKLIIKHFGSNLCVRLRDNSNRFLSALWLEDGEPAVAKTSWKIFDPEWGPCRLF